ncbi:hypothetical protein [Leptothoe spongobia]|uniref:Uncharacterized protein n=1 Tax=Leptothoe spongobia TAU-MAC 1115 TaxID=1967444 RepID=A0A947GFX7_9CYAN|nr:hypothetical protein [Leptothoe spongobia]MBT9314560.1 hypothetical protein [Leptothoe spongobia TAU-MAC 1115]
MQRKQLRKQKRDIIVLSSVAVGLMLASVRVVGAESGPVKQVERTIAAKPHTQDELIRSIWINLNRPKIGYTSYTGDDGIEYGYVDCDTNLEYGLRALYCHIKPFVDYQKLTVKSGLPIFRQGPHTDAELSLRGEYAFGYYNPDFLTWIQEKVLVAPNDRVLKYRFQSVYDSKIRLIARVFYQAHQTLFRTPEEFEAVKQDYEIVRDYYQEILEADAGDRLSLRFAQETLTVNEIKNNYLTRIQNRHVPASDVGFDLGEDCRWLADYLATKHENTFEGEENSHYWYVAITSGGWWVRRSIDGTEEQFFEILTQLLEIYDSEWLNEQRLLEAKG